MLLLDAMNLYLEKTNDFTAFKMVDTELDNEPQIKILLDCIERGILLIAHEDFEKAFDLNGDWDIF